MDDEIDIDGYFDERKQIRYVSKATRIVGNVYRCLAVVGRALCIVEVTVRPEPPTRSRSTSPSA